MQAASKYAVMWLWVGISCGSCVFAQGVDPGGGRQTEKASIPLRVFRNRGPTEVVPPAPDPSEQATYVDDDGHLEILIDPRHGNLKSL